LSGRPDIPSNDALSLELVGGTTPFGWARRISDLPEAGGTWVIDQDAVFTLDLAALPLAGGGFTDILPNVNLDQALDVYIQDDTAVDYMILTVLACPCTPPPPDMISWWPLDETSGPTAADIVGGNDGTHINGPTPIPGMVDGALSFDGKDDVVAVPTVSLQLAKTGLTIDAWVRVDPEDLEGMFVDTRLPGLAGFMFLHKDGRLAFKLENLPGTTAPGPDLRDGQWHHVAVTVDVNTPPSGTLYVDGQNVHTFTLAAVSALNFTQDILIGNDPLNQLALQGAMDEVEIFNRALSAAEIQAIFQSGSAGKCKKVGEADLAIEKSHRGDFQVGQTGTYVINVTNNGPGNASGVTVKDPLPPGFVYVSAAAPWSCGGSPLTCTIAGSWPPGSLPPLILTVQVTAEAKPEVRNCATVTHNGIDPIEDNNTDCDSAVVTEPKKPDLAIEKFLNSEFHYGQSGSYTILVQNTGDGPADSPITVVDDLPPGFTFDSYSGTDWACTASGQQVTCTYSGPSISPGGFLSLLIINVKIDPIATFPGGSDAVLNCATVVHPDDTNPTNDRSCVQTIITSVRVLYSGLEHSALGMASLTLQGDTLVVSNIGSSGEDGVAIDVGSATAWEVSRVLDAQPGGVLTQFALGLVEGEPGRLATSARMEDDNGSHVVFSADYTPIGSPTQTIEVYKEGILVARVTGHPGDQVAARASIGIGEEGVDGSGFAMVVDAAGGGGVCQWWWNFSSTVEIEITGGPVVNGDQLFIKEELSATSLDVGYFSEIRVQALNFNSFTFTEETVVS